MARSEKARPRQRSVFEPRRETGKDFDHSLQHEMNNHLTGILVNAELLLESAILFSGTARKRLQTIIQLAEEMRNLIEKADQRPLSAREGSPRETAGGRESGQED